MDWNTNLVLECSQLSSNARPAICVSPVYGDDDLGKAMAICMQHEHPDGFVYPEGGRALHWDDAWRACYTVNQAWQASETARKQREYAAEEERQRQQVIEFAGKLPRP